MLTIFSILAWIKNHVKLFLTLLLIVATLTIGMFYRANVALKVDNARISENFVQKDKQVSQLNLSVDEFKELNTKASNKIDSLLKVTKLKPRDLKQATSIETQYIDTGSVHIIYLPAIEQVNKMFAIPVSVTSLCWGMKGFITSIDTTAKLEITERTASNSTQILITKRKKFLWWTIRKESIRAFNECGESTVTQINIVK